MQLCNLFKKKIPVPVRHTLKPGAAGVLQRGAAPATLDPHHSVRVTLIQSPATITKITAAQPGLGSKPTVVGATGTQVREKAPSSPHVVSHISTSELKGAFVSPHRLPARSCLSRRRRRSRPPYA